MHISEEGLVSGSVNRAELVEAYAAATDKAVKANLAAVGADHGMHVEGKWLVDPSALPSVPAPAPEPEPQPDPEPVPDPVPEPEPAKTAGRKTAAKPAAKE